MYTLGINAAFHDSSAALVRDGEIVAAAEEERFTQIKHAKRPVPFSAYELPFHAVAYCLKAAKISLSQVTHVAYSFDPELFLPELPRDYKLPIEPNSLSTPSGCATPWEPLLLSYVLNSPRYFRDGSPHHLKSVFMQHDEELTYSWHFVDHHFCHAASAFLPSPFSEAAIVTFDGRGEAVSTTYSVGQGSAMERFGSVSLPHSLGLMYEEVTSYLGFLRSSDEYKVMALAALGRPRFVKEFESLITLTGAGQYTIAPLRLPERFGPARRPGEELQPHHLDVAHAAQRVLEETALQLCTWVHERCGSRNLCLAGGVALNCVMNATLRDRGPFSHLWVQPASGDAGTALGAALWIDSRERPTPPPRQEMRHVYLGPDYSDDEIEAFLRRSKIRFRRSSAIELDAARLLAEDKIIGWFQGRMEFGPRALGARSIIASPLSESMQARLNELKDREDFRPVAPAVLAERASDWFSPDVPGPFMLFVYDVLPEKAGQIPAVCHTDRSARVQTVERSTNPRYYALISAFAEITGVPVVVNTSFNTRGKPIVASPQHALETFWTSPLDALVIGSCIVEK